MCRPVSLIAAVLALGLTAAAADEVLYSYDGDVHPLDPSAGWVVGNYCDDPCSASVQDGHFVLHWAEPGDIVNYHYWIAQPPDAPPPTLWVEWRFRSNHPLPSHSYSCSAHFTVDYGGMDELINMYGDAAISHGGDYFLPGLDLDRFHTYRFESLDGVNYRFSVDGVVFIVDADDQWNEYHYLQFGGLGGCSDDWVPDMVNEWDLIRYGTIGFGEHLVASDPPSGSLDPVQHAGLDRFTVTFDAANYVYLDEITVAVTAGVAPTVTQTRRLDNGAPKTVEIVLDRPMLAEGTTTFTFGDGAMVNVVEYTYAEPPICGDNVVNQPEEECDGTDDSACPGECGPLCTCLGTTGPECGNGIVEIGEECDGADDATCPGLCRQDCTCPPGAEIPTVSSWGLLILTLLLLVSGKLFFSYRRAA